LYSLIPCAILFYTNGLGQIKGGGMNNQEMTFGNFVRQRRREMDLTQEELARRVGCAAITLRKIEADDLRPSVQIAERLAMALAIPLDDRADFVRRARAVQPEAVDFPAITPAPSLEEIGREDLTGRAIRGYALAERIGKGGMGSVYRAVQPNVDREVAVKIILPVYANHPDFIRRFEAEAQLVARLEHPHIVPLYDYWREPGVAYLVMRLLRGGNVQTLLGQGPLSMDAITCMLEQICSALSAAHRMGVIHRDLKPANVMLDEDNNAYLADFGIAKNISNPDMENLTQIDALIGTPQYMSPEQIRSLSIKPQTDIYCLGIMLYEMLTGALPFAGPTPFDMIQQHINVPMPPLSARLTGLPAALDKVIGRATAKNIEDRYPNSLSLFNDFRLAVGGMPGAHPIEVSFEEEENDFEVENPFKGLRAFGEGDAENFFGRETLVQQLLARLGEGGDLSRLLAVIGPSGSGKSSVVRAGLIPALRRGGLPGSENWFIVDMLPGKHPFEELEASLLRVAVNPPEHLLSQMKDGSRGLLRAVHRILPVDESVELVLVIDQFEEVFTLVEDEAERALLLENLATAVLDERSRLRVVITLRADFTDKPLRYVDFGEMLNRRFEFVLPLTPDELERAILSPAQRIGLKLEKGLVSTIIREVGNQPGALPLLQYALSELFDKREGRTLTNKAYQEIGGVLGALGRSAEAIYDGLDESAQLAARQLFLRLVTLGEGTEDTRRRVLREEIESLHEEHQADIQKVIDAFGKARLLSFDRDPITRGATIEVAHEALLREWTHLRKWLTESRSDVRMQRQLAIAASEWNAAKQDASFLLVGSHLEQFEGWAEDTTIALTQNERDYLDASIAERQKITEKEKRSAMRLRSLNRIITVVGALSLVLAIIAGVFGVQSNKNLNRAETEKQIAISRELSAAAISNLEIDPERSILLALQAESSAHTIESENALHRSILASRVALVLHHESYVWDAAYSPDGKRIATASEDKTAKIWDANSGKLLLTLTGHTDVIISVAYSPDGRRIATASWDKTAKIWDANTGQLLLTLIGHTDMLRSIAYSPDGKRLVTTSLDKTAKVWDTFTGEELLTFAAHGEWVSRAAFSPDGKRIASAGYDGNVRVWDATSGKELLALPVDGNQIFSVTFSPDGTRIASANNDGSNYVNIWDAATGAILFRGNLGHMAGPHDIAFSPDGTFVATIGEDQKVKIWDSVTGEVLSTLSGHTSPSESVAFSPDGTHLVTAGGGDKTVRVWDLTPSKEALFIPFANTATNAWWGEPSYSPDGTRLLTGYTDANIRIWDAVTGKELLQLIGQNTNSQPTAYSPDGKLVAAANEDMTITVWDAQTGKQKISLVGANDSIYSIVFSPDGTRLVSTNYNDGKIIIWDLNSGKTLLTMQGADQGVLSVAYSPDGKRLITGNYNDSGTDGADIWDAATGEKMFTLSVDGIVTTVAYSPDGKLVALGRMNGTASVWDASTGKQLSTLRGHTSAVSKVSFSPDGKLLATSSFDGTARVWDVISGVNLLTLYPDSGGIFGVTFSPDGKRLAVGSETGVSIFYLQIQDVIALAKSRVTRTLTQEECQQYLHVDACPIAP
jgi:WD40 repeat protein/transcriptional regulator with XRE-family HTH domain